MKRTPSMIIIGTLLLLPLCSSAESEDQATSTSLLDDLERSLELGRHERLVKEKQNPDHHLSDFTTDGCSGGLSVGWQHLSQKIDFLKKVHGELPPWEPCCVSHDRLYHEAGEGDISAEKSFEARRQADEELRGCVLDTGVSRASELSSEYGLSVEEVGKVYEVIGDLMYRAVRIGGVPCSGLPWRWGYGWPDCN
ncbi:MAG: hypothetical protein KJN87_08955 [Desulfofustis sp.]|nr:hypothetical protein [Desulfofustis sp.]